MTELRIDGLTLAELEAELKALNTQFVEMVQGIESDGALAVVFVAENLPRIQKLLGDKQRFASDYELLEQLDRTYARARAAKAAIKAAQRLAEQAEELSRQTQRFVYSLQSQGNPSVSIIEAARKRLPAELLREYDNSLG
jgi:peptidoglycan hydrolase CwlO-like protein